MNIANQMCGRCGGSGYALLTLAEKTAALCMSCQGEAAGVLNAFMLRQYVGPIPAGHSVVLDEAERIDNGVEVNSNGFFF